MLAMTNLCSAIKILSKRSSVEFGPASNIFVLLSPLIKATIKADADTYNFCKIEIILTSATSFCAQVKKDLE